MKTLNFVITQAESTAGLLLTLLFGLAIFLVIFLILRAVVLWYWKVDVIVRNQELQSKHQEYQNKMMEYVGQLLKEQNELLKELVRKSGTPII